ncbi:rod shape-determining protein [Streptomyces rectiverticillatus]|uniref:rod shape-determining protein n=1 Tax=Streptomyces rectiverticillatus TaxID=173860 RepID=UPI0015C3D914|nr:rod shape-determining protein [Streptomyces rectiverticillatus]QLE76172.1 rod shape-determining protein [Streptomyces rectiverticillatus]
MSFSLEQLRRCTIAVDLGAARTRVYLRDNGLIVDEPSAAAVNTRTGSLIAVGSIAEGMSGRTPHHITVVRPISGGTVVDIDMAQRMLRHLVSEKVRRVWRRKPMLRAAVCLPHDADPLARRAAVETLTGLGTRRVELVDTLIAAAVGCGLPVELPEGTMIVVCGAASTQVAVLSLGSIVAAEKVLVGGDAMDYAVVEHLRRRHELMLPTQGLQPLHLALSADPMEESAEVRGRDVATGLSRTVMVNTAEVREVMHMPLTAVLDAIGRVLRACPPDLVADLTERGVMLAGGSAVLPGLDRMIADATGMTVRIADQPDVCSVLGLGAMMEGKVRPLHLDPLASA